MEPRRPRMDVQRDRGIVIISFLDRKILDELNISRIEDELFSLVDSESNIQLLLDFSNVEHLSSRALGTLISLMKRVQTRQGRLALTGITERIFEIFRITRLHQTFEIYPQRDAGIAALTGRPTAGRSHAPDGNG